MRAFSIQQPWGTLICAGVKDVENRKWALKSTPMRVLIHVGAKRQAIDEDNMPLIWYLRVENAQNMGVLPSLREVPTSAIIGIATIVRCDRESDSAWAQVGPGAEFKWLMRDVKLFKQPILNVKGKLGIFDYPDISEDKLTECVDIPEITREGTHLTVPLAPELFGQIIDGDANSVYINLTRENRALFADASLNPIDTKTVTFVCGNEKCDANISNFSIEAVLGSNNKKPITYSDARGKEYVWRRVFIDLE